MVEQSVMAGMKYLQSTADCFFLVVFALHKDGGNDVANAGSARWLEFTVIRCAARVVGADPTATHPLHDLFVRHLQEHHSVQCEKLLTQHLIEGYGLGKRPRISVHHKSFRPVVFVKKVGNDL